MRLSLLGATCGMASSLLATEAAARKTRLTDCTAPENGQSAPFKQAAEAALKDVEIAWVRDSTGVITARLMAEKSNPRADIIARTSSGACPFTVC